MPTLDVLGNDYFASMDVLKHESCTLTKNTLSLLIRIDNFPSFVTSKARHNTRDIILNNNTRWYFLVAAGMRKYCQTSEKYICINTDTSDQPETLGAFVIGKGIDCSFDVVAKFKFKKPHPLDAKNEFTIKFCFNSSNNDGWGFSDLAKINLTFFFFNLK